jgi:hypothetical protein
MSAGGFVIDLMVLDSLPFTAAEYRREKINMNTRASVINVITVI